MLLHPPPAIVQAQQPGDDFYVEAEVDNATPYVGERILFTFRFYTAVAFRDCGASNEGCPEYIPDNFRDFWKTAARQSGTRTIRRNAREYTVTTLETELFPLTPGAIVIDAARVVIPPTVFANEHTLIADPITVDVQPLPPGAPDGFNGAVGDFRMSLDIDRQSVPFGDPITLTLTVRGFGNLEQLSPPELNLPVNWRLYSNTGAFTAPDPATGLGGQKVFRWTLIPGQAGEQILPEINLYYFDPRLDSYSRTRIGPQPLNILPPPAGSGQTGAAQPPPDTAPAEPAESQPDVRDLLAVKPLSASVHIGARGALPDATFWLLWLIPPTALVAAGLWKRQREHRRRNRAKIRQSSALDTARRRLRASRRVRPERAHRLVIQIIYAYFADRLNLEPTGLNQETLIETMNAHRVAPAISKRLLYCIEMANQARYAPESELDVRPLADQTLKVLVALDGAWSIRPAVPSPSATLLPEA